MSLSGPDLSKGIELADIPQGGALLGHAHGEAVLLIRLPGIRFSSNEMDFEYPANFRLAGKLCNGFSGIFRCRLEARS